MEDSAWQEWFERVWADREERVYPGLFGEVARGIFPLTAELFAGMFGQTDVDPRWLHCGVFEFGPREGRGSWVYVTSGMSNAWEAEGPGGGGPSGLGVEFVMETPGRADWAIERLRQVMAFQILLCAGRYEGKGPLGAFDRIPFREAIDGSGSEVRGVMLVPVEGGRFELESGWVGLVAVVGVTEAEAAYGRERGGEELVEVLVRGGAFPGTDAGRGSLV